MANSESYRVPPMPSTHQGDHQLAIWLLRSSVMLQADHPNTSAMFSAQSTLVSAQAEADNVVTYGGDGIPPDAIR